jgi:RecB family exonuclease
MFEKGKEYLAGYLKGEFNSKKLPIVLEQPFVIPLGSLKHTRKVERPLKIGGKIDRIDKLAGGKIEIIDYKTGATVLTQKQADKDLQLTFYALAASSIKESPFGKKPNKILLSLYYFNGQQKITTTRTKVQLEQAKKEIFEWRKKIEESDFGCSNHFFCQSCEYSIMCRAERD